MDVFMSVCSRGRREQQQHSQQTHQLSHQIKNIDDQIDQYLFSESELDNLQSRTNEHLSNLDSVYPPTGRVLRQRKPIQKNSSINLFKLPNKFAKRSKKIKPSPYHNYQKHLNLAIKQMVLLPALTDRSSRIQIIAQDLWNIFLTSGSSTKRILHFVFNQTNEYEARQNVLQYFGLSQIYRQYSGQQVSAAKNYITQLALQQLTDKHINRYLQQRRLKDPVKFRKYLEIFQRQLQDGFIKKRFTNHLHKWQLDSLFEERTAQ